MWKFSSKNNGFYNTDDQDLYMSAGSWPDDLVDVSDEKYQQIRNDLSGGKILTTDANGEPIAYTPELTTEQVSEKASATVRSLLSMASNKIAPLQDAADLGIATESETASLTAWKTYRVLVNRVPTQPGFPTAIDWPPMPE